MLTLISCARAKYIPVRGFNTNKNGAYQIKGMGVKPYKRNGGEGCKKIKKKDGWDKSKQRGMRMG